MRLIETGLEALKGIKERIKGFSEHPERRRREVTAVQGANPKRLFAFESDRDIFQ